MAFFGLFPEKTTVDFGFSIGVACAATQSLRAAGLQTFSYPFDWLVGMGMLQRAQMIADKDFAGGFMERAEDLTALGQTNQSPGHLCDIYRNRVNQIQFNHDFPAAVPLAESYPSVREKYLRRGERLKRHLTQSSKILIGLVEAHIDNGQHVSDGECLELLQTMREMFPGKEFYLCHLFRTEGLSYRRRRVENVSASVRKITFDYCSNRADNGVPAPRLRLLSKAFSTYYRRSFEVNLCN
ncbi:MAG: DUF1796 family putative cysteine peptidase [Victivallaceae bacterium]|nr:DUF1796 family putative cysteine peptidase [Victivallaceae bacterium]